MNLGQLQTAIAARTGTDTNATFAAISLTSINDAYREIVARFHLNPAEVQNLALTSGTDSYDLNALLNIAIGQQDYNGLIELYGIDTGGNTFPLEQCDLSHLVKLRGSATSTGQPTDFAIVGLTGLEVYPIPSSGWSFVLWYDRWRTANELASAGDLPVLIPTSYHDLLELRGSIQLAGRYESMGLNVTLRDRTIQEYDRRLGEFSQEMRLRQGKQVRRMRVGYRRFARIRPAVPSQDLGGRY